MRMQTLTWDVDAAAIAVAAKNSEAYVSHLPRRWDKIVTIFPDRGYISPWHTGVQVQVMGKEYRYPLILGGGGWEYTPKFSWYGGELIIEGQPATYSCRKTYQDSGTTDLKKSFLIDEVIMLLAFT